jgi:hypothetical protein
VWKGRIWRTNRVMSGENRGRARVAAVLYKINESRGRLPRPSPEGGEETRPILPLYYHSPSQVLDANPTLPIRKDYASSAAGRTSPAISVRPSARAKKAR